MKGLKDLRLIGTLCLTATACLSSTITTATSSPGNTFSYLGTNFVEVEKGQDLVGAVATATFADNTVVQCTFDNTGTCLSSGGVDFSVVVNPATSNTLSADWLISDLRSAGAGHDITMVSINLGLGNSSFSPCAVAGVPDTNDSCGGAGVAKSVSSSPSGNNTASASVFYTNELHIANQVVDGTEWGVVTLTFTGTFGTGNGNGGAFFFKVDSDFVGPLTADVPEPATMAMMGIALLGLATLKLRRKRAS